MDTIDPQKYDIAGTKAVVGDFLGVGSAYRIMAEEQLQDVYIATGTGLGSHGVDSALVKNLVSSVKRLEKKVDKLSKELEVIKGAEIEIRNISYKNAKKEIALFFKKHHGDEIDAADIEEILGIEFEMAMQICDELEKEGKIKSA
jgi:hypothetical protein